MPPHSTESDCATLNTPQPRLTHFNTVPSSFIGPGTPMPTPSMSPISMPCFSLFSLMDAAISGRMSSPEFSVRVGISHVSTSFPVVSKKPIFTVVPPISTPYAYCFIFSSSKSLNYVYILLPNCIFFNVFHCFSLFFIFFLYMEAFISSSICPLFVNPSFWARRTDASFLSSIRQ